MASLCTLQLRQIAQDSGRLRRRVRRVTCACKKHMVGRQWHCGIGGGDGLTLDFCNYYDRQRLMAGDCVAAGERTPCGLARTEQKWPQFYVRLRFTANIIMDYSWVKPFQKDTHYI
ncbi:uncharacterized protein CPUR_08190 [Claviceps purpurea 20.1]|uniref:Uncharacterized protein n=1 Tax=Claviceps purpurea (strain 20.1) TaxID=1111077 RepID=M1WG54_CLAP2|nr:uncharacterized protein CPUR_08190 [Claviceps purpurea 20.1]